MTIKWHRVAAVVAAATYVACPVLVCRSIHAADTIAAPESAVPNWSVFSRSELDPKEASNGDVDDPQHPEERARTEKDDEKIQRDKALKDAKNAKESGERAPAPESTEPIPNAPIVREIKVEGASPEDAKKVQRILQTREGEPLNPVKQREDIKRIYDLGLFKPNIVAQAENLKNGVALSFTVEPNPKVRNISVAGNTQVETKKIMSELPVKEGQVYTVQAQNKIRDSLAKYYEEKGYNSAVVSVEERPAPDNGVDLAITVDEGTKMKIKDMIIHGNNNVGNVWVQLRTENKGSWGPFTHYFNESKFQQDLEAVKGLYLSKGYLDVEVRRGDFVYGPDNSWVSPVIEVTEGPRYKVGRVDARGYTIFSRDEVLTQFRYLQGKDYSSTKFASAADKVKAMYGDEGFVLAKVDPDFHKDPSRGMVDVTVDITEGSRIYVGDVKILSQTYPEDENMGYLRRFYSRFSPPVRDDVVQREVQLRPGQVYRHFDEVRTRDRLKSLNVFETVKVHDQMTADPNVRDCVVEVTQGNTGNLIFGVGFGDVEGAFVYANYVERNLFGMARDLRVNGVIGTEAQTFSISYLDRYFQNSDIAAQFTAFRNRYRRTGDFIETRTGATGEFTRPLSDYVKDAVRLRLEYIDLDFSDCDPPPQDKLNSYLAATIRYRVTRDTRDDTFFPRTGSIMMGSVETGFADGFLVKLEGQYAKYKSLGNDWVFAMNTVAGLQPYTANSIGYADRFFLGGSNDMRGFKLYGAGPHDEANDQIPLGGTTKLLTQLEMRRSFTENITGLAFTDIGVLGSKPFDIGNPRMSVGIGARMRLPIAQIGLDLAVPVIKQSQDQTQFFHFDLTSAF
ncbi:MAG: outer membrane protein assembly factor [Candidatus Sumerlaeaceae bacterium]|nr:outer membrane protein assembly factor [Candidatus Sumerlaeaceae bacterium]